MKKSLLTILCTLLSMFSWAQGTAAGDEGGTAQPYARMSEDQSGMPVLTFYYDTAKGDNDLGMNADGTGITWSTISQSVTKVIFNESFAQCSTITSTALWFKDFYNLTSIEGLQYLNTENVTIMTSMFDGCSRLTSLDLSNFKTDNVRDMNHMFSGCSSLTNLDVSNFKTDNVTDMNVMFEYCSGLTSLDVSNFKTDNVMGMNYMFQGCSGLTSLDVSNFKTDNVMEMVGMFQSCSSLTTIYVGEDWNTAKVEDGRDMFSGCSKLVGGAGTIYDEIHTDHTYAHIDGGENNPGYFTEKNASYNEAYGVLSDNNTVLTLYYDGNKSAYRDAIGLDEMMQNQQWMQNRGNIL